MTKDVPDTVGGRRNQFFLLERWSIPGFSPSGPLTFPKETEEQALKAPPLERQQAVVGEIIFKRRPLSKPRRDDNRFRITLPDFVGNTMFIPNPPYSSNQVYMFYYRKGIICSVVAVPGGFTLKRKRGVKRNTPPKNIRRNTSNQ
jgi:hypothetical protein